MYLVSQRTRLKNRIHATFDKYGLGPFGVSDIFGKSGRKALDHHLKELPEQTRFTTKLQLAGVDNIDMAVREFDKRIKSVFDETEEIRLLRTMPGIGPIFSLVIWLEVGDIERFAGPASLASYSGTAPRVHSSGGKTRYGSLRSDVNRYLKWSFIEAANVISMNRRIRPDLHVSKIYGKIRARKGHPKAVGAVARHLAESTFWILTKKEVYRERSALVVSLTEA